MSAAETKPWTSACPGSREPIPYEPLKRWTLACGCWSDTPGLELCRSGNKCEEHSQRDLTASVERSLKHFQDKEDRELGPARLARAIVGLQQQPAKPANTGPFALNTPDELEAIKTAAEFLNPEYSMLDPIWGAGDEALWQRGESLMIVGPTGVGKTTLGAQVLAGCLGLVPDVVGWPVRQIIEGKILYLAMDRPKQISRLLQKVIGADLADNKQLIFRPGALPASLVRHPEMIVELCRLHGAEAVVIDSLKDAAGDLAKTENSNALADARRLCITDGIEVIEYHHMRKAQEGRKPNKIDDVYGGMTLTAGAGSVLILWPDGEDPNRATLSQIKQPADRIEPTALLRDSETLRFGVVAGFDLLGFVRECQNGATAKAATQMETGQDRPTALDVERVRRRLEKLAEAGKLTKTVSGPRNQATYHHTSEWAS